MKGINKETLKNGLNGVLNYAKEGFIIMSPIIGAMLLNELSKHTLEEVRYIGKVDYDDTVRAILDSSMMSSTKREMISALKMDEDSKFYKAVIDIVRSSIMSSDKLEMVKNMCNKVEKGS